MKQKEFIWLEGKYLIWNYYLEEDEKDGEERNCFD